MVTGNDTTVYAATGLPDPRPDARDTAGDAVLGEVRASLRGLRYGSVNIIVQDGLVIQIDRIEKRRLAKGWQEPFSSPARTATSNRQDRRL